MFGGSTFSFSSKSKEETAIAQDIDPEKCVVLMLYPIAPTTSIASILQYFDLNYSVKFANIRIKGAYAFVVRNDLR